jgi:hypothetical protein
MIRIFILVGLIFVALPFAIYRLIQNQRNKDYSKKLIKWLNEHTENQRNFIRDELSFLVTYKPLPQQSPVWNNWQGRISTESTGDYQVLGRFTVSPDEVLLVTLCKDVTVTERSKETAFHQMSFCIKYDAQKEQMQVFSEQFFDLNDKILRLRFADMILKGVIG